MKRLKAKRKAFFDVLLINQIAVTLAFNRLAEA